jgi:hypothetical protein
VFDSLKEVGDSAISCGLLLLGFSQLSTESVQVNGGITKTFRLSKSLVMVFVSSIRQNSHTETFGHQNILEIC